MGKVVSIRMSDEEWDKYADQAQRQGMGLSTYLKKSLERSEDVTGQISRLRDHISYAMMDREPYPEATEMDSAIAIETLLLLRSIISPEKINMVQSELERQGLVRWKSPI